MAYTVTIYSPGQVASETFSAEVGAGSIGSGAVASMSPSEAPPLRRLKRVMAYGPRCPDCAGPLVFGEGCQLCPVCGYSGCGPRR